MGDIRETFETAHKVLVACAETMEAFGAFLRRIRLPHEYDGSEPYECPTPARLFDRWQQLHSLSEQLEICYLYDPASKVDILRALSSRPRVPVPAMLNVTAETHVEAVYLIGSQIRGRLSGVCESMACSYDAIVRQPNFAADCERAADQLRDYAHNGRVASGVLDYLRRAVAIEETTCQAFFNPSATAEPSTSKSDGWPSPPPADPSSGGKPVDDSTSVPKQRLFGWREILEALGMPNTKEKKSLVIGLNKKYGGPLPPKPGKGNRPEVDRETLLTWWEERKARFTELEQRNADRTATVAEQSNYGRDETVVHGIGGHVKKRRGNDS